MAAGGTGCRVRLAAAVSALLVLSGCARVLESEGIKQQPPEAQAVSEPGPARPEAVAPEGAAAVSETAAPQAEPQEPPYRIYRGSGRFIRSKSDAPTTIHVGEGGDITLDFADADIRQVVKATLGDILGLNYVIAPDVQGSITANTERPLSRDDLLPALESILRLHGVALILDGAIYRVETLQGAASTARPVRLGPGGRGAGYGVQVVPLRYVAAEDMRATLTPLAGANSVLYVDRSRNLLIIAGTQPELETLLDAVRLFDVDWLSGMSFGLFTLENADPKTLIGELEAVLDTAQGGALAGLVRLVPIERMNAVLAISKQSRYLDEVRRWVGRLDRGGQGGGDRQLFIYFVQNGKATKLAEVLNQVFGDRGAPGQQAAAPVVAPGLEPVEIASQTSRQPAAPAPGEEQPQQAASPESANAQAAPRIAAPRTAAPRTTATASADGIALATGPAVRIVADENRNALLISGSAADYRAVLRALRDLDRRPLEVLVEVTIADVTLTDRLEYGVRWFLESGNHSGAFSDLNPEGASSLQDFVAPTFPGLNYIFSATSAKAVLDLLSSVTDVQIISAPQILVLNNQEAQLQVGAQVPVAIQQSISTVNPDAPIVSSVELKDTGVILKVTPRVNEGGLIIMDIEQEVSQVSPDSAAGTLTPTFSKRVITTTAAVQSGQTVALGGLIQDNKTNTKVGVPGLSAIPVFGALFRYTTDSVNRNELLVMVSPRVISDMHEAREITDELRRRMEDLERLEAKLEPRPQPEQ